MPASNFSRREAVLAFYRDELRARYAPEHAQQFDEMRAIPAEDLEALRDYSSTIGVPPSMLGDGEHYALTIEGDSMVEAGILDGDTVVIRRCDDAENGTIVVALVEDHEATLKRLRRKGKAIALEAANPKYETRIFGPDQVKVQGRLVGLMRSY